MNDHNMFSKIIYEEIIKALADEVLTIINQNGLHYSIFVFIQINYEKAVIECYVYYSLLPRAMVNLSDPNVFTKVAQIMKNLEEESEKESEVIHNDA